MKFIHTIFTLFLSIISFALAAQITATERPRLIVGIMVDGLQHKHIDLLWNYFDSNGFKRIINQGTQIRNVNYNFTSAGNASDIASIMTGSIPYYHGISGNNYYDRSSDKIQSILYDKNEIGIGTKQNYSSHNMLASTINDELMMAFSGKAKSYTVAIDPETAILMGGHTAQSIAWIDDVQMKWVTTGYFKNGLSPWADDMNVNGRFETYLSQKWKPLYLTNTYLANSRNNKKQDFEYNPKSPKNKSSNTSILRQTPTANTLVSDLALKIIAEEKMGTDNTPDILMLQFTVLTPNEKFSMQSIEKEDMYLRLDKEIQYLLKEIDAKVGMNETLVFLVGNQSDTHAPKELGENKIPAGYFNANRSMALVNTYLMALYGQERWIEGYYGKNIFLNKKKIDEKKLNFSTIQQQVADFLLEFEGIQTAFSASQILSVGGNSDTEVMRLRNSYHKVSAGDVIFTLLPGWLEVDDKNNPVGNSNSIIASTSVYFYGWKTKQQQVETTYQITDIAPTLSRILNIPVPNANIGKPIVELFK
jgi:hypothetical protein